LVVLVVSPQLASAELASESGHYLRALDRMMVELSAENARASRAIKDEYRVYLDHLVLAEFASLEDALYTGGLVPLPANHEQLNVTVRTEGAAPIAEKDLAHQTSYIAARPAAVGALLDIASRVASGPLEVTSLVRHTEYQEALRASNANANTSVPMHTMGLAFDIALVNTPLARVYEIRDVLRKMQAAGDILFIGERRQLVFHVVPHPSRLGYYTDVYAHALRGALPLRGELPAKALVAAPLARPVVHTEVATILPTDAHAEEWWAAADALTDLSMAVTPRGAAVMPEAAHDNPGFFTRLASRFLALLTGVASSARIWLT
jgi:hypothetical protein